MYSTFLDKDIVFFLYRQILAEDIGYLFFLCRPRAANSYSGTASVHSSGRNVQTQCWNGECAASRAGLPTPQDDKCLFAENNHKKE